MTKLTARRNLANAVPQRGITVAQLLLILHLGLSPLLFWRGCADAFELAKVSWLILAAILLAALGAIRGFPAPPGRWRLTDLGVALFVLSAAASTANSLSWRYSLWGTVENRVGLIAILALAVLFFATRYVCNSEIDRRRLLLAIPVAGMVAGCYALVQATGRDPFAWADMSQVAGHNRPASSLGHPNMLGAFLAMALPITLAFARQQFAGNRRRAFLFAVIALVELAALILTLSRAAWLAAAVASAILLIGWRPRWKWIAVGAAAAILLALLMGNTLFERARHLVDASGRLHIWKAAGQISLEHPLLGCGPEAFQLAFLRQRTPEFWAVEWGTTPAKAHNEMLHLLATQGLLGMAAMLVFLCGLFRDGRDAWRKSAPEDRAWFLALMAALAAFATQAQFGYSTIGVLTVAAALAALVRRSPADGAVREFRKRSPIRWFVFVPAGLLIYWLVWLPLVASHVSREGQDLLTNDTRRAKREFARACELAPDCDANWSLRGRAAMAAADVDPNHRQQLKQEARDSFAKAIQLTPANAFHRHNLAMALADVSPLEAFAEFDEALRLDPNNAEFALDATRQALRHRDARRASRYIECSLASYPNEAALQAESAYLLLLRDRPIEAIARLDTALAGDWRGDAQTERRALDVRAEVLRRLSAQNRNVNEAIASTPKGRGPVTGKPAAMPRTERGSMK